MLRSANLRILGQKGPLFMDIAWVYGQNGVVHNALVVPATAYSDHQATIVRLEFFDENPHEAAGLAGGGRGTAWGPVAARGLL
jgi:hypothetical protein